MKKFNRIVNKWYQGANEKKKKKKKKKKGQ